MAKKKSWFNISDECREEWENLCPIGEYRVISGSDLPGLVPQEFKDKCINVFIMASGSGVLNNNDIVYFMINYNRYDPKEGKIDQEPFGVTFIGSEPQYSGTFIHHGDWENRSTDVPEEFLNRIKESEIPHYVNLTELPSDSSGKLENLNIDSQKKAFERIVSVLSPHVDKQDNNKDER